MDKELLLEKFKTYIIDRGFSKTTQDTYLRTVKAYLNSGFDLSAEGMMQYLRNLNDSKNTINTKFYILKTFLSVLNLESQFPKAPKVSKLLPRYLEESEAKKLLKTALKFKDIKAFTIIAFLLYTGVRVSELVKVRVEDISFENNTIRVRGKGDKERLVPISKDFAKMLKKYAKGKTGILFTTKFGKPYTRQGIYNIVEKYAYRAGIKKNVSPHILRHTFATIALNNGSDPFTIQAILGHESLNTTLKYAHVLTKNLKQTAEHVANAIKIEGGSDNVP